MERRKMDYLEYMLDVDEQRRHQDEPDMDDILSAIEVALKNTDKAIAILAERVCPVGKVDDEKPF
jgi:hypothetical protein